MTEVRVSVQDPQQGWTAVADGGVHVLVGWGVQAPGLERVRAAAAGGLDEVLDALTVDGVRRAPDFVAVEEGAPLRVVARGSAYAVLSGPGVEQQHGRPEADAARYLGAHDTDSLRPRGRRAHRVHP